jgi:carboxypeptidase family protein/TonB-dependent receptor-like protein
MSINPHTSLRNIAVIAVALATLFLFQIIGYSQTDQGRIVGTVTDVNGGLVPGASIVVKNERTGEERTGTTNESGNYMITGLRPSTYSVTANAQSLTAQVTNIQLLVGQELTLPLMVQPTGVEAKVDITAGEETAINTGSAAMGANVNPREVEALPLNGRQLSQLYLQAPGSVNSGSGTFGDIRFNGRAVEQNIVRYDGVEGTAIIDASPGNLNGEVPSPFRLQSSLENVQEFRVDSSNFPAEFGTGTGGQISVVTKSGGNRFHGSVFEYLRNDALDAANFFDNIVGKKAPLRLNQFGGSIGGPIVKNKTFFFFSYEGYRLRAGINSIEAVPGAQSRICAPAPGGVPCIEGNGSTSRTLILLPAFRDPKATIISTGTGSNLFDVAQVQASSAVNETAYAFRLDHKLNAKHSMYFRYFRDQGTNDQPEGVSGRRVNFVAVPQNAVVALQSILKPTLLNEFKVGFNGAFTRTNGVAPIVNGIDISKLAINISGNTANFAIAGQGTAAGTSNPGGLIRSNSATNGRGQPYTVYSLSFIDNLNWTNGNHNYKFGVEYRPSHIYTDRLGGTTYVFNNLTDFLANRAASIQYLGDLSDPSPFNGGVTGNRLAKQEYYIAYGQDEWKIRPNLTLNYGLRYEYYTPLREANNLDVLFNTVTGTLDSPERAFFKSSKKNFAPRLALTYSPNPNGTGFFGGGRTVLRGGFGIYYGPGQTEDQIQPIEIDRISSTVSNSAFDPNVDAFVNTVRTNFINNPNNRVYQPRAYAPEYTIPEKVYSYTFSMQQELPHGFVATVAYVGSQGRNLFLRGLTNTLRPGQTSIVEGAALPNGVGVINRSDPSSGRLVGVTSVRQFDVLNNRSLCNLGASAVPICRPYAEIDTKTSGGSDSYNALQMTLNRRFNTGLTLNGQYSFSKSFGTTSGSNEARTAAQPFGSDNGNGDFNNYEADRGYNSFDVRHTYNLSAVYTLPIGKGKRFNLGGIGNKIFGDLEIGTILNGRSGLPIDVTITRPEVVIQCTNPGAGCNSGEVRPLPGTISTTSPLPAGFTAVVNAPGGGASRQTRRPNLIAGVNPYLGNDRQFLNPAAFAIPAPGAFGNLPRNALKGPGFRQIDFILNKRFRFSESKSLEFRTEVFNILNRANFGNPASTLNNALGTGTNQLQPGQPFTQAAAGSTFGLLRSTVSRDVGLGTNRQIQFALRLNF